MSMILIDSVNHRILDVMKDRGAGQLSAYFNQYSPAAQAAVKTITVDLFTPNRAMIKDLFPNANIVADRFHVVTQAYREFNKVRIGVMKQFGGQKAKSIVNLSASGNYLWSTKQHSITRPAKVRSILSMPI